MKYYSLGIFLSDRNKWLSMRVIVLTFMFVLLEVSCQNQFEEVVVPLDKTIALTFDDGPDPVYTAMILDILKENGVKATFFLVGSKMRQYPQITERIYKEGHCVANHTMTHFLLTGKSVNVVSKSVLQTEQVLDSICGESLKLFRPPWGKITKSQKESLQKMGFKVILWDVNSDDYKPKITVNDIIYNVMKGAGNKKIVLFHDSDYLGKASRKNTVLALPRIISFLKETGYSFVSADKIKGVSY